MSALNRLKSLVSGKGTQDESANADSEAYSLITDAAENAEVPPLTNDMNDSDVTKTTAEKVRVQVKALSDSQALSGESHQNFDAQTPSGDETTANQFDTAKSSDEEFEHREIEIAKRMKALGLSDPANASAHAPEQAEPTPAAFTPQRSLGPVKKTDNLAHIRQDLAQLNEDMSTGEQFYAQSLKRISNLINYAYETEANLAALEQLEPENRRLTEMLDIARKTATDQTVRAESLKSKADAYEARYMETRQSLEKSQLALTKLEQDKDSVERELAEKDVEIAGLKNSNRTIRNELTLDRQTQEKLAAKALTLSSELSLAQSEKLELEKRGADLQSRYEHMQAEKEQIERLVAQTRSAHKATEEHNIALKTEIEQILADVQLFKKQFDTTARQRDHEINALRANVSDLKAEVGIKTDIVSHTHEEMAELREKHDAAHRGRRKLLDHIESEKLKADALKDEIETAKSHTRTLYSQIVSAQAEADQLRRTNQMQSEKLAKYMALNTRPVSAEPSYPRRSGSSLSDASAPEEKPSETKTPEAPAAASATLTTEQAPSTERRSPNRPFQSPAQVMPPLRNAPKTPKAPAARPTAHYEPVAVIADPQPNPAPGVKADAAMRESARYGMVGGISADYGMGESRKTASSTVSHAPSTDSIAELDTAFAQIDEAGVASQARAQNLSEADQIEDTLANFHEIDLLDNLTG